MNRFAVAALSVCALSLSACGVGAEDPSVGQQSQPLTWEEFRDQAVVEEGTGIYIVNGDEPAENLVQLNRVYLAYRQDLRSLEEGSVQVKRDPLIVNTVNGADDKWPAATAMNLTYCVSKKDFGTRYQTVVAAMASAASEWESAGRVNFVHDVAQDDNCTPRSNVVFDVQQVCKGQYLARAFFPSTSRRGREVLIDCTSFGNIAPWTLTGVLRHELGHTIGFRHEHTRPEAGTCFENNSWRALTAYDSSSVMHYPQCNGTQNGDLALTSTDRQGAGILYP